MVLNHLGIIVQNAWNETELMRVGVTLDEYIVMPNHFHGIVTVNQPMALSEGSVRAYGNTPLQWQSPSRTVGAIVRGFKSSATGRINAVRRTPRFDVWQRNYYERVIRNDCELNSIREYIRANPANWKKDEEYVP